MKVQKFGWLALVATLLTSLLLAACGDNTATSTSAASTGATAAGTTAAATTTAASATSAAAATATTAAASGNKPTVIVGSKNFTESILVAEMYALALEQAGIKVQRKFDLGSVDIAQAAITKGDISVYPEYTGTALLNVLKLTKTSNDPKVVYDQVAKEYESKFKLTILTPAPMNNTNGVAVTKAVADKYKLKTLSDLSKVADQLRFAAIADFVGPRSDTDGLGSLQKAYGGFKFKDVKSYEIPLRYQAVQKGDADAVVAFSTDGEIAANNLVLMEDDKLNFPPYQFAPVVRDDIVAAYPNIKDVLNAVSAKVTTAKAQQLNSQVDIQKMEAPDVAKAFLKQEGILK